MTILCTLFLLANITFSQDISYETNQETTAISTKKDKNGKTEAQVKDSKAYHQMKTKQTREFEASLMQHLAENLVYPEAMEDKGIEGKVVISVSISSSGKAKKYAIVQSLNQAFDDAVLDAMKNFKGLNLKKGEYIGAAQTQVPLKFSLR